MAWGFQELGVSGESRIELSALEHHHLVIDWWVVVGMVGVFTFSVGVTRLAEKFNP